MPPNENPGPGWTYNPNQPAPQAEQNNLPEAELPTEQSDAPAEAESDQNQGRVINWTASEFVANHKDSRWHFLYFLALAILIAVVYFITHDIISTVSIAIVGGLFVIIANRKPRQLPYQVNEQGVGIGSNFHAYESFKSFSLSSEGPVGCINFMPLKRLMPEISIYFPPDQADSLLAIISDHVPHDQRQEKRIDSFAKKIGF